MWMVFDYFATSQGIEVRLFRTFTVYRLRRTNIVAAHLVEGMLNFRDLVRLGSHPWNTISMGNRWRKKWVMVEKRCWPRFLAITPPNPEEFVASLLAERSAGQR
jgi:hypothetical protein